MLFISTLLVESVLASSPTRESVTVDGVARFFYVQRPSGSSPPSAGYPVIVSYHGWCGTASGQAETDGLRQRAATTAIVVHPEGYSDPTNCGSYGCDAWQSFNGGGSSGAQAGGTDGPICEPASVSSTGWQCYESCRALGYCTDKCRWSHCLDDAAFFRAILSFLQANGGQVDSKRVFATGHSNGAMMMYGLAADSATAPLLAAVAPVSGIPHNGFNVGSPTNRALRYLEVQGTHDTYVQPFPSAGGRPDKSFSPEYGWYYSAWQNTTDLWASQRGLAPHARAHLAAPSTFNCSGWGGAGASALTNETVVATCFYDGPHSAPSAAWDLVLAFFGVDGGGSPSGSCPECDGYSCDEWIAWDPSRYSCPELQKDDGCDCSGCQCAA